MGFRPRRYERVPFFREVGLAWRQGTAPIPARTFDISIGGVGIFTQVALERGQPVKITFSFTNSKKQKVVETVDGRVAYFRATEDGNQLGIEFLEPVAQNVYPELTQAIFKL